MESPVSNQSRNKNILIGILVVIGVCCACVLIVGAVGVAASGRILQYLGTAIPGLPLDPGTATPVPVLRRPPVDEKVLATQKTLRTIIVPENDPYDLSCRLQKICNVPKTLPGPTQPLALGAEKTFWILNSNTNENFQITAQLKYITPHTYFWAEDGTNVNLDDLKALMDTFETKIYPTDREFFGSEWTPGVDNDPHIYVVYAGNIGFSEAGYFSTGDEYNPQVRKYSNAHETFVIGSSQSLSTEYTYTTLAHEFVHMIQFPSDRNDVPWINEGFADLGAFLNGYGVGGADWLYVQNPDLQLNDWSSPNSPSFAAHYGNSFLYLAYFLDRFGKDATKALTANPENDLTSVDDTLANLKITDSLTGKPVTADDVYSDWATALFLQNGSVGDGRFTLHNYPEAPQAHATDTISDCPSGVLTRNVHQYGVDYVSVNCVGTHTLHFKGSTVTGLLPIDAHSGTNAFWSNKGDESDMTLTRSFDFTKVTDPITLSYWTWYDLETDYDYLYLEVSEDGKTWEILKAPSSTNKDPTGAAYGWGYSGQSNGWVQEQVDVSAYKGKKIQVRFEYITDAALNGEGLLLDDIHVDAVNYSTDFEKDDGGWTADGFARVENILPQTFRLMLIVQGNETTVRNIEVTADQTADIPLTLSAGETATLVITGTTRFTRELAVYTVEVK